MFYMAQVLRAVRARIVGFILSEYSDSFEKNDADTVWPLPAGDWTADADDCDAYSTTPAAADDGDATADDGAAGAAAPGAADGDGAAAAACAGARSGLQHPASAAREVGQAPGGRADAY